MDINNTDIKQFTYSGKNITGLYSEKSYDNIGSYRAIAYGFTSIDANAFGSTGDSTLAKALGGVKRLYIPRTINTIGNNAFTRLSCLEDLIVEPGTSLTSIGTGIFKNCFALNAVKFYS